MSSVRAHLKRAATLSDRATVDCVEGDGATTIRLRPHTPKAVGVILYLHADQVGTVALDDPACGPAELGDDPIADTRAIDDFISAAVPGRATAFHLGRGGASRSGTPTVPHEVASRLAVAWLETTRREGRIRAVLLTDRPHPHAALSARLPLGVGLTESADLIAYPPEECLDLIPVAAHPRLKLPLLDGLRAVQDLVESVVDPEGFVAAEVHVRTVVGCIANARSCREVCGRSCRDECIG